MCLGLIGDGIIICVIKNPSTVFILLQDSWTDLLNSNIKNYIYQSSKLLQKETLENDFKSFVSSFKGLFKYTDTRLLVVTDIPVCALESLQQSKVYQKEQRRQFKELKELVRRHQKKTSELLREFNNKYKKMARQCSKSR